MKKIVNLILLTCLTFPTMAQQVEMADSMRSEGKIYVVVAIIMVIFIGLIAMLYYLDKKISRIEKIIDKLMKNS